MSDVKLVTQPSALPGRKPLAAAISGPVLTPYILTFTAVLGIPITPELAALISSGVGLLFAYFTRERGAA